jgi:hypothetical protein
MELPARVNSIAFSYTFPWPTDVPKIIEDEVDVGPGRAFPVGTKAASSGFTIDMSVKADKNITAYTVYRSQKANVTMTINFDTGMTMPCSQDRLQSVIGLHNLLNSMQYMFAAISFLTTAINNIQYEIGDMQK